SLSPSTRSSVKRPAGIVRRLPCALSITSRIAVSAALHVKYATSPPPRHMTDERLLGPLAELLGGNALILVSRRERARGNAAVAVLVHRSEARLGAVLNRPVAHAREAAAHEAEAVTVAVERGVERHGEPLATVRRGARVEALLDVRLDLAPDLVERGRDVLEALLDVVELAQRLVEAGDRQARHGSPHPATHLLAREVLHATRRRGVRPPRPANAVLGVRGHAGDRERVLFARDLVELVDRVGDGGRDLEALPHAASEEVPLPEHEQPDEVVVRVGRDGVALERRASSDDGAGLRLELRERRARAR